MDLRQFGAVPEENFFHVLNKTLQKRDPIVLDQIVGCDWIQPIAAYSA